MKEAMFYQKLEGNKVRCNLCRPKGCKDSKRSFLC